jgi:hypothetical protein
LPIRRSAAIAARQPPLAGDAFAAAPLSNALISAMLRPSEIRRYRQFDLAVRPATLGAPFSVRHRSWPALSTSWRRDARRRCQSWSGWPHGAIRRLSIRFD